MVRMPVLFALMTGAGHRMTFLSLILVPASIKYPMQSAEIPVDGPRHCPGCASARAELVSDCVNPALSGPAVESDQGRLWRCSDCALVWRTPIPTAPQLLEANRALKLGRLTYQKVEPIAWAQVRRICRQRFGEQANVRILDVGCYDGQFLDWLGDGYERYGVEPSADARATAINKHHVSIIGETLSDLRDDAPKRFDVITLLDVYEHIERPQIVLEQAAELLKPGGVLIISTGDFDSRWWRLNRSNYWYLQTPFHLVFASPRHFRLVAASLNLTVDSVIRHAHIRAPWLARLRAGGQSLYLWTRTASTSIIPRLLSQILPRLPGLRGLVHLRGVRFPASLADHVTVVLRPTLLTKD